MTEPAPDAPDHTPDDTPDDTPTDVPTDGPAIDDGLETPRRYWVGVVIVVLAILLVIGFALVTFVASDNPSSTVEGAAALPFWQATSL